MLFLQKKKVYLTINLKNECNDYLIIYVKTKLKKKKKNHHIIGTKYLFNLFYFIKKCIFNLRKYFLKKNSKSLTNITKSVFDPLKKRST